MPMPPAHAPPSPILSITDRRIARVPCWQNYRASFQETGDIESSVWSCGPVMGLMEDVPSCEALVSGMVDEAEAIIKGRLAAMCR